MKKVQIEITIHDYLEDVKEKVTLNVPDNLTEKEENKFIEEHVEDIGFFYGY